MAETRIHMREHQSARIESTVDKLAGACETSAQRTSDPASQQGLDVREGRCLMARVLRGGSWNNNPNNCRSAYRNNNTPDNRNNNIGFRIVLPLHFQPLKSGTRNCVIHGSHGRGLKVLAPNLSLARAALCRAKSKPSAGWRAPIGSARPPSFKKFFVRCAEDKVQKKKGKRATESPAAPQSGTQRSCAERPACSSTETRNGSGPGRRTRNRRATRAPRIYCRQINS